MSHKEIVNLREDHRYAYNAIPSVSWIRGKWSSTGSDLVRKLSEVRRPSETLHRTESMVSLCYKSLSTFINENNLLGLQQFLENKQVQVDDRDENGSTALMLASAKGKSNFVRELLSHGADPNAEDSDNWSALLCAAKEGHVDICLQLLEHNAELEHRDMGGWTALMWATYKGRTEVATVLLDRHADPNAHGNYHIPSLLWAAGRGHTDIVEALLSHGAKVNIGDKYGTTALIWAARKGHTEIVKILLAAGANTDTAGMYSWTPLLVATHGNHTDVVSLLLEHRPNVNALDKDGCAALTIACKEGYYDTATALMSAGAYINVQDRAGDTNLIHAVKGGHRGVVEALLKRYADVDVAGKERKTALYVAVEKGFNGVVKVVLAAGPDLEICTKDGDTPLLKAVRSRNAEIVQLLLDKKAKVSAADKKGDTSLHIAMRARSKAIVEILLRNPKHSHLLYRPNRAGETPYNIDINHQKTILGQIFGARRLNTNEDNENMLGYDLYSSALADILSEPSLSMPITVGLYAKWGSGKSFLLNKLREEMKNFARQYLDPTFQFSSLLFLLIVHAALLVGTVAGLSSLNWMIGVGVGVCVFLVAHLFLALVWFANKRYDWDWPYNFNMKLTAKMNNLKRILQVLFCHPPGAAQQGEGIAAQPIRFYFTDQTRVSSTTGGENSVVQMLGSLYDAIEADYGSIATRLYRAFKPKPVKSSSTWKWRKLCCLPYIVVFELTFLFLLIGTCALTVYLIQGYYQDNNNTQLVEQMTLQIILITAALVLGIAAVANLYTWTKMFGALFFSQRRHLQRTISKLETLKSEGFLQALRYEVTLMKDMVKCLDSLSSQQTRLVIIVDGLDSSEQDKVLLVLDAVHMLFSDANCPFIVILAIDPHVISKAVEINSRRLFSESNIGGHGYLNNMVHLPFYLQNSGLRKVSVAQQTAQARGKSAVYQTSSNDDALSVTGRSLSARRLSSENILMSSTEKIGKFSTRKGSRKLKMSESIASSIGSNMNRIGGAQDLTKMLLTDDYFSDVNPRSMRRLMNVVYITGRLLKAFKIDFSWYRLASWINITEQWPFRTSWIIYHFDLLSEESLDDNTPLKSLYDKIRPNIPTLKDTEPLLELDRDERKFDVFLSFHRSSLLVSDLKIFLPFTINLDPYLKKVIKEETQDDGLIMGVVNRSFAQNNGWNNSNNGINDWQTPKNNSNQRRSRGFPRNSQQQQQQQQQQQIPIGMYPPPANLINWNSPWSDMTPFQPMVAPITTISPEILDTKLSTLSVDGVCKLVDTLDDVPSATLTQYKSVLRGNNINGRVLVHCDLDELKQILGMNFGDWEMFKVLLVSLRENEMTRVMQQDEGRHGRYSKGTSGSAGLQQERKGSFHKPVNPKESDLKIQTDSTSRNKQSVMEKQVTLEEQMICGALQTLNEEACEDVMEETEEESTAVGEGGDIPITLVVPPSPPDSANTQQSQESVGLRQRSRNNSLAAETEFLILQSSPVGNMHWQPIMMNRNDSFSDQSSRCSSPRYSPVLDKPTNSFKMSNLKSTTENETTTTTDKKLRHVVIQTDETDPTRVKLLSKHTNSVTIYESKLKNTDFTNTAIPSISRPITLNLNYSDGGEKTSNKKRNQRSKSIDCTARKSNTIAKNSATVTLSKLKDALLHSNPELNDTNSDNENTPLVSDNSTPSTSIQTPGYNTSSSNNASFKSVEIDDNKLVDVIAKERDFFPTKKATFLNTPLNSPSDSDSSLSLSFASSKLLTASNTSLNSKFSQNSLSRQDALDKDEVYSETLTNL